MNRTKAILLLIVMIIGISAMFSGCRVLNDFSAGINQFIPNGNKTTEAVQVGEYTISNVELNYYYIDAINDFCNAYQSYVSYLLDISKPLDQQIFNQETGETWADYFLDVAYDNMRSNLALFDAAKKEYFDLPGASAQEMENKLSYIGLYASMYGYSNSDDYLVYVYGEGATLESYRVYVERCYIAEAYYNTVLNNFVADSGMISDYEQEHWQEFNSYDYAYFYIPVEKCYREDAGLIDNDGNKYYTEEETAAAGMIAQEFAYTLVWNYYEDTWALDDYIYYLVDNFYYGFDIESEPTNKKTNVMYSDVPDLFQSWISCTNEYYGTTQYEGNMAVFTDYSYNDKGEYELHGYYVVRFGRENDNRFNLVNVRHILFKVEDEKDRQHKKDLAEQVYYEWIYGDMSEDSFIELVRKYTDDGGSRDNGGLYEDIYPGQMVDAFNDWCFDENRWIGDNAIIETEYGYHLIYFAGYSDVVYRDMLIEDAVKDEYSHTWHNSLVEAMPLQVLDASGVNTGYIIGNATVNDSDIIIQYPVTGPGENSDIIIQYPANGSGQISGSIVLRPGTGESDTAETSKAGGISIAGIIIVILLILALPILLVVGLVALVLVLIVPLLPLLLVAGIIILVIVLVKKKKNKKKLEA